MKQIESTKAPINPKSMPVLNNVLSEDFIVATFENGLYLLEKAQTPLLDKYAMYGTTGHAFFGRLYFDVDHYFKELNVDQTIDRIIEIEKWFWSGENCDNSKKTFELLDKIKEEDKKIKSKKIINYREHKGNESFRVVAF
jgi:hypothetical protein